MTEEHNGTEDEEPKDERPGAEGPPPERSRNEDPHRTPTPEGARAMEGLMDGALKALARLPRWLWLALIIGYALAVFPWKMPPGVPDGYLEQVLSSRATMFTVRMCVPILLIGGMFILRSVFAMLAQRRYADSAGGVAAEQKAAADHTKTIKELAKVQGELEGAHHEIAGLKQRVATGDDAEQRLMSKYEAAEVRAERADARVRELEREMGARRQDR